MCGIIAFVSSNQTSLCKVLQIILKGLIRMEYRGYDSAGVCFDYKSANEDKMSLIRSVGFISKLEAKVNEWKNSVDFSDLESNQTAMGHTRWATHGVPCERNCHPMVSNPRADFRVVHNGIITNYDQIKKSLMDAGHSFSSDTDTEVIPILLKDLYDQRKCSFVDLCYILVDKLQGSFALAITSHHFPGECVGIRYKSPLIVGVKSESNLSGQKIQVLKNTNDESRALMNSEFFLTSDPCAIVEETRDIIYLCNRDVVHISNGGLCIFNSCEDLDDFREVSHCPFDVEHIRKGRFKYFMEKEIYEQDERVRDTLRGRIGCDGNVIVPEFEDRLHGLEECTRIIIFGCGTSFYSGLGIRPFMQEMTRLEVTVVSASEFLDFPMCLNPQTDVYIFVSQSGETADLLSVLAFVKQNHGNHGNTRTLCLTNNIGSTLARECSVVLDIRAGPELGVASTKAYTCQTVLFILVSLKFSQIINSKSFLQSRRSQVVEGLGRLSDDISHVLSMHAEIKEMAEAYSDATNLLLVGRGYSLPACYESSLKIKELSYIHSSAINAGELKHGPLALVDEKTPIIFFLFNDEFYDKSGNALQQIVARKGRPVLISCGRVDSTLRENCRFRLDIPKTVDCLQFVPSVVAMQIFAMEAANLRGYNVDRPRNLAKSVTVE